MGLERKEHFFSPELLLTKATNEYKHYLMKDQLTPSEVKLYWDAFYNRYDAGVKVPDFPGTREDLLNAKDLSMEAIYVTDKAAGPDGINYLQDIFRPTIEIYNVLPHTNILKEGGWRYAQTDRYTKEGSPINICDEETIRKEFKNENIVGMDFPTYITMAVHNKNAYNHYPDEQRNIKGEEYTWTLLSGSPQRLSGIENKPETLIPGVFFTPKGRLYTSQLLKPGEKHPTLINRLQIPINPRKPV